MNPIQNRIAGPGQTQPAGPQPQVPDLILDAPRTQPQAQPQAQPQGPGATTMPYQAPAQAVVQKVMQDMSAALMEMGMAPTTQNQQMAQMLASYGHGVNTQTMGILRQAIQALPDKSMATLEAAVILLSKDLPVNEQTVMAVKQFLNSAPLPQQLQNLPRELGALMQQLQQTAQSAPQAAAALPQAGQAAAMASTPQATAQATPAGAQAAALPAPAGAAAGAQGANPVAGQPVVPLPGSAQQLQAQQTGQPAQQIAQQAQQVAQQVQSGQSVVQGAASSAIVQQAAGQLQSVEHRADGVARLSERSTAEKVAVPDVVGESVKMVKEVNDQEGHAGQSRQVSQHLPSARPQDQQSLQQLFLHLQGGETGPVDAIGQGAAAAGIARTPEEALLQLLRTMQSIGQIAGHLGENMQLRDFSQLFIQHQQIVHLTGLLEHKLQEFHQLFARAFPELSHEVQKLLQQDGLDMFSKLAQLLDENQSRLHERLKLTGGEEVLNQALSSLRGLMEQVGFQIEKVQAHLLAREMLSQNLPMHVLPLTVHFKGEAYPAEVCVQQDYDPGDPHSGPNGERPFKITLTLETKNMGRVAVDLATLKDDMMLDLKVQTRRIKLAVDERLQELRTRVETDGDYKLSHLGCQVNPDLESRQSMLLPQKRVIRSMRRIEGVV